MFHNVVDLVRRAHWPADLEGPDGMIRADTIRHCANPSKTRRVLAFVRRYRDCAASIASVEWRTFFARSMTQNPRWKLQQSGRRSSWPTDG